MCKILISKASSAIVHKKNFNAICIVYGSRNPYVPMIDRERTYLFHSDFLATSMYKHIEKLIAKSFQNQHIRLYKQYKDSKTLDMTDRMYLELLRF